MQTVTFLSKKDHLGRRIFQITVKKEFLDICPNPEETELIDLVSTDKFNIEKYLHCETDGAFNNLDSGGKQFYLNGVMLSFEKDKEAIDRIIANGQFNTKFDDLLKNNS